ncbi:MAG: phosphatidate cytidylyltransferase [Gemmatimonadota bacterium]|nr:MAG: phosphatidate cytidylyltransferase [Gemmatimonadota bacterium]
MTRSGGELGKRVGVALIGIPVAVGLVFLGGYWLAGFVTLLAMAAAWEFAVMHRASGVPAAPPVAAGLAAAYVLLAANLSLETYLVSVTLVTLVVIASLAIVAAAEARPGALVMTSVFGALYTGATLGFALRLRAEGGTAPGLAGAAVLMLPVAITWLGDTVAYFVGKAIGRHELAPVISPKKTWEGAIAGFFATAGGALLYVALTRSLVPWTMSAGELLGLGAMVAVVGQAGDLVESRFKRECGVKDSSGLLPGHGGILDRLDAVFFVFPFAYAYIAVLGV